MKIIDYGCLMPGSERRLTAEDWERAKKAAAELTAIAKEPIVPPLARNDDPKIDKHQKKVVDSCFSMP